MDTSRLTSFLCIGIFSASLFLAITLAQEQKQALKVSESAEGVAIQEDLLDRLQRIKDSMHHLVEVWSFSKGTPQALWEKQAKLILSQQDSVEKIAWINVEHKPSWLVERESNTEKSIDLFSQQALLQAKKTQEPIGSAIYDERGSLKGETLYFPLFSEKNFDGYLAAVVDIEKFLQPTERKERKKKYRYSISHRENLLLQGNLQSLDHQNATIIPISLLGLNLDIKVQAMEELLGTWEPHLPKIILILGGILSLFMFFFFQYTQIFHKKESQSKIIQEQLQRARNTLTDLDKLISLGTLTAGIAHEVKNPLSLVKNFSELSLGLLDEMAPIISSDRVHCIPEDRESLTYCLKTLQANLVRIHEQSKRADSTVQRMLAHSRGAVDFTTVDVHGILDEYITLSYYAIRAQYPRFEIKFVKRYDQSAPKVTILAEDMSRVFLNLLNNAYYALAQKKKKEGERFAPELTITTRAGDAHFEISIRDNGPGIPESAREKIFSPFFTTKPPGIGTGLGLCLSRSIVIENGGSLDFISKEGEFTEFLITLPTDPSAGLRS